jgi:D-alanyl-lipoteichoic acid acyltransferase DltB (MBOAT superfamily)
MLFNSVAFAIFLPACLTIYWWLRTPRRQNAFLVGASLFFYGWWDWRFVSLILISAATDYVCALGIERQRGRGGSGRLWLGASLVINLGMLGVFKYYDFFVGSAEVLWGALGWRPDLLHVVLPIGISFYTFQTLSYTIDVYRGRFEARRSLVDVAAYVTFFPQLVAGPIERAANLLPQMERARSLTPEGLRLGSMLMLTGFVKKLVIADGIAPVVDWYYAGAGAGAPVRPEQTLLACCAFSFQIYGDFAGYSDIARGAARLMGFDLVVNFRQPFFAPRFAEILSRWHISLSTWLRDYLFIPLGGSRHGRVRTLFNLALVMVLAGLWHGASWTFAVWGGMVGTLLVVDHLIGGPPVSEWSLPGRLFGCALTFSLWTLGAIFFRGPSIDASWRMVESLTFGPLPFAAPDLWRALAVGVTGLLIVMLDLPHELHPDEELPSANRPGWALLTMTIAAAGFYLVRPLDSIPFIYFQF